MATDTGFNNARVLGFFLPGLLSQTKICAGLMSGGNASPAKKGGVGCQHFSPRQPGRLVFQPELK
jgi:hypothetical protein